MSTLDQLDDSFPHGSLAGYQGGCRTNHCPAPVTCTVFRTRYVGDWRFRGRVDAGWTAAQIVDAELEEVERARVAEKAARAAERQQARNVKRRVPKVQGRRRTASTAHQWTDAQVQALRDMHAAGEVDPTISESLGIDKEKVAYKRQQLGLPGNRPKLKPHGTYARHLSGCETGCPATPSCTDAAHEYWRVQQAARRAGMSLAEYRERKDAA